MGGTVIRLTTLEVEYMQEETRNGADAHECIRTRLSNIIVRPLVTNQLFFVLFTLYSSDIRMANTFLISGAANEKWVSTHISYYVRSNTQQFYSDLVGCAGGL